MMRRYQRPNKQRNAQHLDRSQRGEEEDEEDEELRCSKRARRDHPYGIKPLGNLLLDSLAPAFKGEGRTSGLGAFAKLSDELLLTFLGTFLTPRSICRLARTSKAFYLLGRHEELWRGLVIERFGSKGTFRYHRTWCETFARSTLLAEASISEEDAAVFSTGGVDGSEPGSATTEVLVPKLLKTPQDPISVDNYYSDYLYQAHICATQPLYKYSEAEETIDRRENLSVAQFIEEYEKPGKPVIITDVVKKWPAYRRWNRESLVARYGDRKFTAEAVDLRLTDYLAYSDAQSDESPLYLFDKRFGESCPELAKEYDVPEYFREDLFRCLGDGRPDYRWLIIGPARSGSTFHKDPNHTSAWNAVITGAKKWVMFPPNHLPPGVFVSDDESEVTSPVSLAEWFVNFYKEAKFAPSKPLEGICRAGEMIFVPAGWWHAVINIEFSIAVTQNYVSQQNLPSVLTFLRDKPDQISGIRCSASSDDAEVGDDRRCEDEKSSLYKRFSDSLAEQEPEIWARASETLKENERAARLLEEERSKPSAWENLNATSAQGGFSFSFSCVGDAEELEGR